MKRLFLLLALAAAPLEAQIALVSHAALASDTVTTTPAFNTTGANFLIACAGDGSSTPTAPSDSAGNTWKLTATSVQGFPLVASVWTVFSPITSASETVTFNGNYPGGSVSAFSGVASGPDGSATGAVSSGPITPANANELVYACLTGSGGGPSTPTVGSPLTAIDSASTHGYPGNTGTSQAYQIQTAPVAVTASWSVGSLNAASLLTSFYSAETPKTLSFPSFTLPEAFVGASYSFPIPVTGGVSPDTCTLTSGTLPGGFSLSGCTLTASSPASAATTTGLVFHAVDSQSHAASSAAVSLTVAASPLGMATSCPAGTQLTTYAGCNLAPAGGTPPYTVTYLTDRNHVGIPEGLSIAASTGVISGSLTGEGVYATTYSLTDAAGANLIRSIPISVSGNNAFTGTTLFPTDNLFHGGFDLTALPVDTAVYTGPLAGHVGITGPTYSGNDGGIPLNFVPATQPNIPVSCPSTTCFQNPVTSGPFSASTAIEATQNQSSAFNYITDGHALILQAGGNGHPPMLYESYNSQYDAVHNAWQDVSNFSWDLTAYSWVNGAGSTDAAGLPILPFVLNYDDVMKAGGFTRLIRFTIPQAQTFQYHIWPATDQAGGGGSLTGGYQDPTYNELLLQSNPPTASVGGGTTTTVGGTSTRAVYGGIWRVKASYFASPGASCLTNTSTNPQAASIFYSMRHTGMILADNGAGIDMQMTDDPRWSASDLACLYNIPGSALEQVNMTSLITADSNGVPLSMRVKGAAPIPAPFISGSQSTGGLNQW